MGFTLVKEYLKTHKVVITYVRNGFGFPMGVVIAIGKNKIGYSQVHHRHDYEKREDLQLHQLPAIQRMMQRIKDGKSQGDIFQSKAYQLYQDQLKLREWGEDFKIPHFDRNEGLRRAIEMAENGIFKVDEWLEHPWDKPLNNYMREAITDMIARSQKVKAFQE
jgi:hypothetical protein